MHTHVHNACVHACAHKCLYVHVRLDLPVCNLVHGALVPGSLVYILLSNEHV